MKKYRFTLTAFDRWLSAVGYKDIAVVYMDNTFVDHFRSMLDWGDLRKYSDRDATWHCEGQNIPIYRISGLDPRVAVIIRKNGTCTRRGFEYARD